MWRRRSLQQSTNQRRDESAAAEQTIILDKYKEAKRIIQAERSTATAVKDS